MVKMKEIKSLGVWSVAKLDAIIMAIFGLLLAIISFFLGILDPAVAQQNNLGAWILVVVPVAYTVLGFIAGALGAYIYNIAAKKFGGIKIDIK